MRINAKLGTQYQDYSFFNHHFDAKNKYLIYFVFSLFLVSSGEERPISVFLTKTQSKTIRLINNPNLTKSLQPLSRRRLVGYLSIFYRYFNGHCSQEIRDIIPVPLRRVRTTRSSTHLHPFQVSLPTSRTLSHKSSFIPRICNL